MPLNNQGIQQAISAEAPGSPFVANATPFFDRCEDSLMSLHLGGRMGLLDLFNWQVSNEFLKTWKFITYARPDSAGTSVGWLPDPCADPNSFEFGTSQIVYEDFARYGRMGPTRDIMKPEKYCSTDPRYRLDGSPITSETEWDMRFIMDVLRMDLFKDLIVGDDATAGQMNGLQTIINTGYDSSMLDSMVIDWAANDTNGAGGTTITLNGVDLTSTPDLIDLLLAVYRRFLQRMSWSPQLSAQPMNERSFVMVAPTTLCREILNKFTCWSVCEGGQYNEVNLNTYEARTFRDSINGGIFNAGYIWLDGQKIHLMPYDWETMHDGNQGDIYFMTMAAGASQMWEGEHLSAAKSAADMQSKGLGEYFSTDGGRILGMTSNTNLCIETKAWVRPRLLCRAPWLQSRIMNVVIDSVFDPISPDPASDDYPLTSFGGDTDVTG